MDIHKFSSLWFAFCPNISTVRTKFKKNDTKQKSIKKKVKLEEPFTEKNRCYFFSYISCISMSR